MFNQKKLRGIAIILIWILVIALVISTFSFMVFAQSDPNAPGGQRVFAAQDVLEESGEIPGDLKTLEDLIRFIEENYVDEISRQELMNGAYQGVLESLDPYSVYYVAAEDGESFSQVASGVIYGLGVQLVKDEQGIKIADFYGNSSGERAGLAIGDYIVSIDGVSVMDASLTEATELLRGDLGSVVHVQVRRGEENLTFQAVRAKVLLHSVTAGIVGEDIGYMSISNFYEATDGDVRAMWEAIQEECPQVKGLVVDIRDNPGGLVNAAVRTADLFLDQGKAIMHYEKRGEIIATFEATEGVEIDVPTVVLVNENTASAAEIFAAALKDHHAATVVGDTTYGKGAAQVVYSLENGASLKLTVYHFLSPEGNLIHQVGVSPDITIHNSSEAEVEEKLHSVGTLAPMSEEKKYGRGESGLNVFGAQQRLIILGESALVPTGKMDEETFRAVERFQEKEGLYPYGVLDYATMEALEEAIAMEIFGAERDDQFYKAIELLQ